MSSGKSSVGAEERGGTAEVVRGEEPDGTVAVRPCFLDDFRRNGGGEGVDECEESLLCSTTRLRTKTFFLGGIFGRND